MFHPPTYLQYLKIFSYDGVSNAQKMNAPTRATPHLSEHAMTNTHTFKQKYAHSYSNVYMSCPMPRVSLTLSHMHFPCMKNCFQNNFFFLKTHWTIFDIKIYWTTLRYNLLDILRSILCWTTLRYNILNILRYNLLDILRYNLLEILR